MFNYNIIKINKNKLLLISKYKLNLIIYITKNNSKYSKIRLSNLS